MDNRHHEIIEDELSIVDVYAGGQRRTLLVSDQPTSQLMGGTVGKCQQRDPLDNPANLRCSAPTLVQLRRAGDERFTPCVPLPQSSADTSTLFTVTHLNGGGVFFVILH